MRTTLTLDDDVAERIEEEQRRSRLSLKEVVNRLLRQGLERAGSARRKKPFRTTPHAFGFKPGIDPDKMNQLADDLEAETFRNVHVSPKVILPDINVLIHAHDLGSRQHERARKWWDSALSGEETVGLTWVALLGFIRITTHRGILSNPWPVEEALARVQSWLAQPSAAVLHPTHRHADVLADLLRGVGTGGNLTTDAHLAALAIEHEATLCSTDRDFGRFPGLLLRNPLAAR